jgi:hypothetical protein
MTIEEMMSEFGLRPLLRNIAAACEDLSKKAAVGTTDKPFHETASEKVLELVSELDKQERMINHILFNTKR